MNGMYLKKKMKQYTEIDDIEERIMNLYSIFIYFGNNFKNSIKIIKNIVVLIRKIKSEENITFSEDTKKLFNMLKYLCWSIEDGKKEIFNNIFKFTK